MSAPITLPASLERFTALQEQLIQRRLSDGEQEATAAWLEIINAVAVGNLDKTQAVRDVDHLIGQVDNPFVLRFLQAARCWILRAGGGKS